MHAEVVADGCKLRNTGAQQTPAIALLTLTAGCEARTDLASPKRGPGGSNERPAARHNGLSSPRQTPCTLVLLGNCSGSGYPGQRSNVKSACESSKTGNTQKVALHTHFWSIPRLHICRVRILLYRNSKYKGYSCTVGFLSCMTTSDATSDSSVQDSVHQFLGEAS